MNITRLLTVLRLALCGFGLGVGMIKGEVHALITVLTVVMVLDIQELVKEGKA